MADLKIEPIQSSLSKLHQKLGLIISIAKSRDLITIDGQMRFQCKHCGLCCKSFEHGIFIGVEDLRMWLENDLEFMFGAISYDKYTRKFRLLSQKEFLSRRPRNKMLRKKILDINPALKKHKNTEYPTADQDHRVHLGNFCIFFDDEKNRCSFYEHRPLICRLYPLSKSRAVKIDFEGIKKVVKSFLGIPISPNGKKKTKTAAQSKKTNKLKVLCPPSAMKKKIKPDESKLIENIYKEYIGNLLVGPYQSAFSDEIIRPLLEGMLLVQSRL